MDGQAMVADERLLEAFKVRVQREDVQGYPFRMVGVWLDDDLIGAGQTEEEEALEDARKTVRGWAR